MPKNLDVTLAFFDYRCPHCNGTHHLQIDADGTLSEELSEVFLSVPDPAEKCRRFTAIEARAPRA